MNPSVFVLSSNEFFSEVSPLLEDSCQLYVFPSLLKLFFSLGSNSPDLLLIDGKIAYRAQSGVVIQLKMLLNSCKFPVVLRASDEFLSQSLAQVIPNNIYCLREQSTPAECTSLVTRVLHSVHGYGEDDVVRGMILSLVLTLGEYDIFTGRHMVRAADFVLALMHELRRRGLCPESLAGVSFDVIAAASQLHDIGKVIVPAGVLNKPAALSEVEFESIRAHPERGERIIDKFVSVWGDSEILQYARAFAGSHHEQWGGAGYPYGLSGVGIPFLGRVMAIADVYDALVSTRPYRDALPSETACKVLTQGKGSQFDPILLDVFLDIEPQLRKINFSHQYTGIG